jgi:opacity protein-like surface antigen
MDKLSLESRVLVGASMVKSPDFDINASLFGFTFSSNTKGESVTSVSTLFGTGVKYNVTDKIGITANVDYWMTSSKTKSTTTDSTGDTSTDESTDPIKISTLNFNLGIAYKLF